VVPDLEHMVVTVDQARHDRARSEIDLLRPGRNRHAPARSHLGDAITLDDDHLVARQAVRLAVEQLPGVNHHCFLTFNSQTRPSESERE
jgi:hypothetical protein